MSRELSCKTAPITEKKDSSTIRNTVSSEILAVFKFDGLAPNQVQKKYIGASAVYYIIINIACALSWSVVVLWLEVLEQSCEYANL